MAGVSVTIGANTAELESAVKRSKSELQGLSKEMKAGIDMSAKLAVAAVAAGAALVTGLAVKGMKAVDAQAKLSAQLGGTITGLRAVTGAAGDAGVSAGVMASAMERLNARIGEAQRGTGQAAESFKRLGLDANALAQMDVDQRMATIADRMHELGLSTQEAGDELRQMGIRNGELINLMRQGGDAIRAERDTVDALGLSLSKVDARQVEMANDAMGIFEDLLTGVTDRLAVEVAPIITAVATMLEDAAKEAGGFGEAVSDSFGFVVESASFVMNAIDGIKRTFELVADSIIATWNAMATFIARRIENILEALDAIPGMDMSNALESVRTFANTAESVVRQAVANMDETLMAPMQGDEFKRFVADAQKTAEELANESLSGSPSMIGGGGGRSEGDSEAAQKQREALEKSIEQIRQLGLTETEVIQEKYKNQSDVLKKALEEDLVTREEYDNYMVQAAQQRDEAMAQIGEAERERLNTKLEAIREANMTELELLKEKYLLENEALIEALEAELITKEEYNQLLLEQKQRYEEDQSAIEKKASDQRIKQHKQEQEAKQKALSTAMGNMTTLMNTGSRKMFEIGKAFALAQAIVDGYAAIVGAYKVGASQGGPALGAAYAAAAGAATFAQIASIKSQSFSGGKNGNSGGSGTGSATGNVSAASQPAQSPSGGTLTVKGISANSLFTGDFVSEFANELLEYQRRGGNVVLQS